MKSPFTGEEMRLVKELTTLSFRKENFSVVYHCFVCDETGERFTNDEVDHINQIQVYNQYRERHGIPFPEQIIRIREKYHVSARKMSEILGLGTNTYRLYEAGEIPSIATGRLIRSVEQPEEFIKQVRASANILSEKDVALFTKIAEEIDRKEKEDIWEKFFERNIFQYESPNQFSGYKKANLAKISQVIAFFNGKLDLYKTKLNKLLFYTDFALYQKQGLSLTGITYRAIPYGPVPAEYEILFRKLSEDQKIEIKEIPFDNGHTGELIKSKEEADLTVFTEIEKTILEKVVYRFKSMTTNEIVNISHNEPAWIENKDSKNIISYQKYAYELKGFDN